MSFDPDQTSEQISQSVSAMLLLNSSCQALIQVSIAPSSSPWYPILDQELGKAENLVVGWRQNGFLYFQQDILQEIGNCGNAFLSAQPGIDKLFDQLQAAFSDDIRQQIVQQLNMLESSVGNIISELDNYNGKLSAFQSAMEIPYQQMNQTVAQVQAQEQEIQAQIQVINAQIASLQQQVQTDRKAIAEAKAKENEGIAETIFGILFAPFSFGASLILAGIGVASIAEAEAQVHDLQNEISKYQSQIAGDQSQLTSDQAQVATLQGLIMSVSIAINDMADLTLALQHLRVSWALLQDEVQSAAGEVQNAETYQEAIVARVFFDAACNAWQQILKAISGLADLPQPVPTHVMIGQ